MPANDGLYEVFDKRFKSLMIGIAHLEKLADGCIWAEGPVWFADGGYLLWSDIPNNRMLRWMPEVGVSDVPRRVQQQQRQHPRPPGPARDLRAPDPPRDAHRAGRLDHRDRRQAQGQAPQFAERRGGEVRRQHLVHRPQLRHHDRVRRQPVGAGAGRLLCLSRRSRDRRDRDRGRGFREAERPCLLARREDPLHRRFRRLARPQRAAPHPRLRRGRRQEARQQPRLLRHQDRASRTASAST